MEEISFAGKVLATEQNRLTDKIWGQPGRLEVRIESAALSTQKRIAMHNNNEGTTTKRERKGKNAVLVEQPRLSCGSVVPMAGPAKILRRFGRHEKIKIVRFQLAISSCPAPDNRLVTLAHQSAAGDQAGTGTRTLP